jgi:hypothetical protein
MAQKTLVLTFTKSTKNTHVYSNTNPGAPVGSIYIRRESMSATPPAAITLQIDWEEK